VLFDRPAPWHRDTAFILIAALLVVTALAIAAILIESSRIGYRLGVATLVVEATVALLHSRSPGWYVGAVLIGASSFFFADRLGGWVRERTPDAPVPARAVALAMIILAAPGLSALVTLGAAPGALPWLAGSAWFLLLVYARRLPGALLAARGGPLLLSVGAVWLPDPGRWLWLGSMLLGSYLASSAEVRLAVRPLIEPGSRLMIPPELAPEEIRRALGKER
jgi:hypothetical protein